MPVVCAAYTVHTKNAHRNAECHQKYIHFRRKSSYLLQQVGDLMKWGSHRERDVRDTYWATKAFISVLICWFGCTNKINILLPAACECECMTLRNRNKKKKFVVFMGKSAAKK